jgi:carboxymethylenebutenolidase
VKIPTADGEMPAYRAAPVGRKRLPTLLVVQEIFGVHEHIRDLCRRFAKLGMLAIAPELYARQGNPASYTDIQLMMRELVSKVPDSQVLGDLDATAAWARGNGGHPRKLAITGFCWGGRIVWLYAAHSRDVKAGIAWYGRLAGEPNELQPRHPIDVVGELKAPVLGLYAGKDRGISLESVERMRVALQGGSKAARASEIIVYPDAQHGFNADYRASYSSADSLAANARLQAWLRTHGVS